MEPDFQDIEYTFVDSIDEEEENENVQYSEEYHFEGVRPEIKDIYLRIKGRLLEENGELVFNPQHYYISIKHQKNIAYFKILKSKMRLVVMLPEEVVRSYVRDTQVHSLSEGVQNFYGAPCCELIIDSGANLDEVVTIIKMLITSTPGINSMT